MWERDWPDPGLLAAGELLVWWLPEETDAGEESGDGGAAPGREATLGWLSPEERARAEGFRFPRDRRRFVRRRRLLRAVLAGLLGRGPAELRFEAGVHGKPRLVGIADPPRFSLSHSHGAVLVAVAPPGGPEPGIDLERDAPERDLDGVAARILAPEERGPWESLPAEERPAAFLRLWTRKEAVLKALGLGFQRDPRTLCLGWEAPGPDAWGELAPGEGTRVAWTDLEGVGAHAAALALVGGRASPRGLRAPEELLATPASRRGSGAAPDPGS